MSDLPVLDTGLVGAWEARGKRFDTRSEVVSNEPVACVSEQDDHHRVNT